jgi:hypothetical protein
VSRFSVSVVLVHGLSEPFQFVLVAVVVREGEHNAVAVRLQPWLRYHVEGLGSVPLATDLFTAPLERAVGLVNDVEECAQWCELAVQKEEVDQDL